jgi:dTDP-glucose pyrophosphorylase
MQIISDIKNLCVNSSTASLKEVLSAIDVGGHQIALFLENDGTLIGVMTDGDVRRALLKGFALDSPAERFINRDPVCVGHKKIEFAERLARKAGVNAVVIGEKGQEPEGLFVAGRRSYAMPPVFILAGGKGLRLRPATETVPKPLIPVGGKPILHRLLENLASQGFEKFYISVNYLAQKIKESLGTGDSFGIDIEYVSESVPLGTAGSLGLLENREKIENLLVLNADLLVDVDFTSLIRSHVVEGNAITIGVREHQSTIPFGVIEMESERVKSIVEKPTSFHLISAGIYCVSNGILTAIERNHLDMPNLIEKAIFEERKVGAFLIHRDWIDIGRPEDLERANSLTQGRE